MSPNRSNSSSSAPIVPSHRPDSAPIDEDRYKVGVELEDVTSAAGESESVSRARANRATTNQPPRSMCFMVENCKWCRREAQPRSEPGRVSEEQAGEEEEESPAVSALRECLETLERDRLKIAGARRRDGLVQRCLKVCGKGV